MIRIPGVKDFLIIDRLRYTIGELESERPDKFLTNGLIIKRYLFEFPEDAEIPKWYIRGFIKGPHFRLDSMLGWRSFNLVTLIRRKRDVKRS